MKPWCNLKEQFEQITFQDKVEKEISLNVLQAWKNNGERRYMENRPGKWWVVIEFLLMGTIAGYFIPLWCGMIVNPHVRTRIDTLFDNKFPGGVDHILTDDTLLLSYDY